MKVKLSNGVEYEVNSTGEGTKLSVQGALRRSLVVNYELEITNYALLDALLDGATVENYADYSIFYSASIIRQDGRTAATVVLLGKTDEETVIEFVKQSQDFAAVLSEKTDAEIVKLKMLLPEWESGKTFTAGSLFTYSGQAYRAVVNVTAQAHQTPASEGMLAVYRPVSLPNPSEGASDATDGEASLSNETVPFVYGMDVASGTRYSYDGHTWLAKADMASCVWAPGTAGLWQWELIEELIIDN